MEERLSRPGCQVMRCAEVVYLSKTVTHPGTNRAQRRVTTLIETNVSALKPFNIRKICISYHDNQKYRQLRHVFSGINKRNELKKKYKEHLIGRMVQW